MAGSCDHDSKLSGCVKESEFLVQPRDYWLLQEIVYFETSWFVCLLVESFVI
jgi:hypothetical protein